MNLNRAYQDVLYGQAAPLYRATHDYIAARCTVLELAQLLSLCGEDRAVRAVLAESHKVAEAHWRRAAVNLKREATEIANATIRALDQDEAL